MTEGVTMNWIDVAAAEDVADNQCLGVQVNGTPVALVRQGDKIHALHDLCTHGAARLSDGYVEDGCIECPLHQGLFDLATGAPVSAPVTEAVKIYPARCVAGRIEIAL
jgi:nitrite reductase/ring-hydroxylating ferredoxin subunit